VELVTPRVQRRTGEGWPDCVTFGVTTVGGVRYRLRCWPVRLQQATEVVFAVHGTDGAVAGSLRLRWLTVGDGRGSVPDALVRTMLVEEALILANRATQAVQPEQDQVIEAVPTENSVRAGIIELTSTLVTFATFRTVRPSLMWLFSRK